MSVMRLSPFALVVLGTILVTGSASASRVSSVLDSARALARDMDRRMQEGKGPLDREIEALRQKLDQQVSKAARLIVTRLEDEDGSGLEELLRGLTSKDPADRQVHEAARDRVVEQLRFELKDPELDGGARTSLESALERLSDDDHTGVREVTFVPGSEPRGAGVSRVPPDGSGRPVVRLETITAMGASPQSMLILDEVAEKLQKSGRFQVIPAGAGGASDGEYSLHIEVGEAAVSAFPRYRPSPLYRLSTRDPRGIGYGGAYVLDGVDYHAEVPLICELRDVASGRVLSRRAIRGTASGFEFVPGGFYPFGGGLPYTGVYSRGLQSPQVTRVVERAFEDALTHRKAGLVRLIEDLLPMKGEVLEVVTGKDGHVKIDLGEQAGIGKDDRLLVFDAGTGEEIAILRARRVGSRHTTARVHHREGDKKKRWPKKGDIVVTQGY